MSASSEE
jgi:transposase